VPRFVVKVIVVPLCGGVPLASMTWAMMSVVPLDGRAVAEAVNVIVDPLGASSGTFSQARARSAATDNRDVRTAARRRRDIIRTITILIPMDLAGQGKRQTDGERGYAMAALLVALGVMAVMFTVVMPVWKQTAQREKEEELVFRGKQYVHAIGLFQRKFANAYPPNVDVLVEQRFLRKKFKDPITNDDFVPIPVGQGLPASGAQQAAGQRGAAAAGSTAPRDRSQSTTASQPGAAGRTGGPGGPPVSTVSPGQSAGGISGVTSKSKNQSIRLYNGRGHYNEWAFVFVQQQQAAGAGAAPGTATPGPAGQRGQPGQPPGPFPGGNQPGQRGGPGGGRGPNGPGRNSGFGTFGSGGVTPIQPPSTPRGRL
jgi:type II secretory pathway pseudopilin PulG